MILVRPMERKDIEAVSVIEEETFSMPWSRDAFLQMIEDEHALYIVAEEDGKILGSCGIRNIVGEGEITNVAVQEENRNRGIGKHMLTKLLEESAKMGIEAVTLEVRKSNLAAIHVYEMLGFASEGIRPGFYEKPREDAVIMWKR